MYNHDFYPDGLTEPAIDLLLSEVSDTVDDTAVVTSALMDGTAARRRTRRAARRAATGVVRTLPLRQTCPADTAGDADTEGQVA